MGRRKASLVTEKQLRQQSLFWPLVLPVREWTHYHPPTRAFWAESIISILQKGKAIHITEMGQVLGNLQSSWLF